MRSRNLCFTSFDLKQLDPSSWEHCTYAVWQMELAPATLAPHWQGYAEFDQQMRIAALHQLEGLETAHFEPRRGTQQQAIVYCQKEDTRMDGPYTFGTAKSQGQRTDLLELVASIKKGHGMKRLAEEHAPEMIKYPSGIKQMVLILAHQRAQETICFVFYGAGGCGKSTFAARLALFLGYPVYYLPAPKGGAIVYWDGYNQGDTVIIEEFKGNRFQPTEFNMLVDRHPHKVPTHGGLFEFDSKYIIITTNVPPMHWWPSLEFKRSLRRRLIIWPIFRNLAYTAPRVEACFHCANGLCAFHHP